MAISKTSIFLKLFICTLFLQTSMLLADLSNFDGLGMNLGNLYRLSDAKTRSISAENFSGEKGKGAMATEGDGSHAARELGQGWKVSPSVHIQSKETFVMANIKGSGAVQHIWITPPIDKVRLLILRMYWDDEEEPSVEVPLGDFFACGYGKFAQISSLPVCVNPGSAFNCYWVMPFRKSARITIENISDDSIGVYYQVDYTLTEVQKDAAYFHAQFRRTNPVSYKEVYTILDGVKGKGHYIGTYMLWTVHANGWWGEGEIKFYMDGDNEFPTICGTGTEDYFLGSYAFAKPGTNEYLEYTTPFAGMPQVIKPNGSIYSAVTSFGLYRWHVMDPIRFEEDLKVTMQCLGWKSGTRYLPRQDDLSSVAY